MLLDQIAPYVRTFIDVGANVGSWSEHMLKLTGCRARGFLFEPSTQCVKLLKDRFEDRNVLIRDVAVSDQCGTAQFVEEDQCGETSSILQVRRNHPEAKCKEIFVTTLDAEFAHSDFDIDFLKVDTEGFDLKVLKGGAQLLSRTRFLQLEYNSMWLPVGSSLAEATRFLDKYGFSTFLIRSSGLHPLKYEYWNDYFRYSNYFACRSKDIELVRPILRGPL